MNINVEFSAGSNTPVVAVSHRYYGDDDGGGCSDSGCHGGCGGERGNNNRDSCCGSGVGDGGDKDGSGGGSGGGDDDGGGSGGSGGGGGDDDYGHGGRDDVRCRSVHSDTGARTNVAAGRVRGCVMGEGDQPFLSLDTAPKNFVTTGPVPKQPST